MNKKYRKLLFMLMLLPMQLDAQVCDSSIAALTPSQRFVVNANDTVIDKASALMWKRCSEGQAGSDCASGVNDSLFSWTAALQRAQSVNNAGFASHKDWRVPNIKELQSLLEIQCSDPAINLQVFPGTISGDYWSSSSILLDGLDDDAWYMDFRLGQVNFAAARSDAKALRLVRDYAP